jgi:hypothetical protein
MFKVMKEEEKSSLLLKWGTLKGWHLKTKKLQELMVEYRSIGSSCSAMMQQDTDRQKEIICLMIDECDGDIQNDWSGEIYTNKEDAKRYIMEYGAPKEIKT